MRSRTMDGYQVIKDDVTDFIAENAGARLEDYVEQSGWSARHVQRALAYHGTSWRKLKERSRHDRRR